MRSHQTGTPCPKNPGVKDYLLFIDIEASGLPQDWEAPYAQEGSWPFTVQVAWAVFTQDQQEVKKENHYIKPDDFEVSLSSIEVHHLTPEFLHAFGESRNAVLRRLQQDLEQYRPLVIGHFMEFDYHVLSADFFRAGLPNPLEKLDKFCTMRASGGLRHLPAKKFMRLGELYSYLFHHTLENQHNAVVDADATAACYFELRKRRLITPDALARQQQQNYGLPAPAVAKPSLKPWLLGLGAGVFLLLLLLFFWL